MEPMVKGYMIQSTCRFILQEPGLRERVPEALLTKIEDQAVSITPVGWYPRRDLVELWRAIAAAHPDEASARASLNKCGRAIGSSAVGTFLKLLFKVLTPRMFSYKFPDLWQRDSQGGHIEVQSVEPKSMKFVFKDVEGFDHLCAISEGWVGFVLVSMGLKGLVAKSSPWSLSEPGPRDVYFEAVWQ